MGKSKTKRESLHAKWRAGQRDIPPVALELIKRGKAFKLIGKGGTKYHVLKDTDTKWYVGVERDNTLITVYDTENAPEKLAENTRDTKALKALAKIKSYRKHYNSVRDVENLGKKAVGKKKKKVPPRPLKLPPKKKKALREYFEWRKKHYGDPDA